MAVSTVYYFFRREPTFLSLARHCFLQLDSETQQFVAHLEKLQLSFKRFFIGVFVSAIFAGAFAFNVGFDAGVQSFWDRWNKGVRCINPSP
jgi:predicted PurR-regulated permease PerM